MPATEEETKAFIEEHRAEIEDVAKNKPSVIAYITDEEGESYLNVLDFKGDGGDFHRFPINKEACIRLAAEAAEAAWVGRAKPRW